MDRERLEMLAFVTRYGAMPFELAMQLDPAQLLFLVRGVREAIDGPNV